ncbi:MAG: phosphoserine phosphatase SerB [Luminiphilus sp.]
MPNLPTVTAFLEEQRIQVVEKERLPVVKTLADVRCAQRWYLQSHSADLESIAWSDLGLADDVDINFQHQSDAISDIKLAVFDMDSTLIQCEVIDELATRAGVGDRVAAITERAMRGELDFNQSLSERLGLLRGLEADTALQIARNLPYTDGARELMTTLRALGVKTVIISGGFSLFAEYVAAELAMDEYFANTLEVSDGRLTGVAIPPIVNAEYKEAKLREIAASMGISMRQTLAIGDGANDLKMLNAAGIGIAFRAKPVVRSQARYQLSMVGLDGALYFLGNRSS